MRSASRYSLTPYIIATSLLSPLIALYTLYRSVKDGGLIYLRQRYGFSVPACEHAIWVHCASVGEINTASRVIEKLSHQYSNSTLLVSTNTPTGKAVFLDKKISKAQHCYLPLDHTRPVRRVLKRVQPKALLIMETELWPILIHECAQQGIPIVLFNARMTAKTSSTYRWLLNAYAYSLHCTTHVLAKSEKDGSQFIKLGLVPKKLTIAGNLKFSGGNNPTRTKHLPERPYWLAVSTHDDEEARLCKAWLKLKRPELLIVAPRHPERRHTLVKSLSRLTTKIQLRSSGSIIDPLTSVYILDTLGELQGFMSQALVVFVGGSLVPRGGHNVIEPAILGKAVITGPYTSNFSEEVALLNMRKGMLIASDEYEAVKQVRTLIDDPSLQKSTARNAYEACQELTDIDDHYVRLLRKFIPQENTTN